MISPPNKFTKFIFKHFSSEAEWKDAKLNRILISILIITFLLGFVATAFNLPRKIISITFWSYSGTLIPLVLSILDGVLMNNFRIRKIRKELGLSKIEYNELANYYL
jgi:hypothetical protein